MRKDWGLGGQQGISVAFVWRLRARVRETGLSHFPCCVYAFPLCFRVMRALD
jgi:hypothetical protein